jgi:4,4'-diaponeurosporenoate glycosyltransferase
MYPHGISDLIEGWSKGFGSGAVSLNIPLLLLLVGWVWACFNVFIGVIQSGMGVGFPIAVSLILYMLFVLQIWWMLRRVGNFHPLTAVLFPLPLIFFALIMLRSLFLIFIRQRVTWRGRDIPRGSREK